MIATTLRRAIAGRAKPCDVIVSLNGLETYCLDEWIEKQAAPCLSRGEAIRRLMRIGLTGHPDQ